MEEFSELTYIRGEVSTYEYIQQHDPETFVRILQRIEEGRWDVVGGTFVQPDNNLPATETLLRHFTRGLTYCQRELGRRPTVAWSADCFGHSAGLPAIFAAAGMKSYAFSRPAQRDLPLEKPAFWWEGGTGQRVLAWRIPSAWYGTERDDVRRHLDEQRDHAGEYGVTNIGVFYGLGNHGGGPTRRQLREIRQWSTANPDVEVIHSGLHRLFADLHAEAGALSLPVVRGELNFTLRGCYASAGRFKATYRRTENLLQRAEKTATAITAAGALLTPPPDLRPAWDAVLFNSFHDILPGTSIERAFDDQFAWLGFAYHQAQRAEVVALNALAKTINTSVEAPAEDMPSAVPVLVWNPHPYLFEGLVEIEMPLDFRPVWAYTDRPAEIPVEVLGEAGKPLPFQRIATEHFYLQQFAWKVRVVVPLQVPSLGWQVIRIAYNETPRVAPTQSGNTAGTDGPERIHGGGFHVQAQTGGSAIHVSHHGRSLFGEVGLTAATMEDPWGSWGGLDGEVGSDSISVLREVWKISQVKVLEGGPERAVLWARLEAGTSRLELSFALAREAQAVEITGRIIWNERAARLKLLFPSQGEVEYEVPGGTAHRGDLGEVPGGRWVRAPGFCFASDAIYNFETKQRVLNATLVRSCRYGASHSSTPEESPERPYMDLGEHRFRALLAAPDADVIRLVDFLEQPLVTLPVASHPGVRSDRGSLGEILTDGVRMLAFKPAEDGDGWIIRLQGTDHPENPVRICWLDKILELGKLDRWEIGSWRLVQREGERLVTTLTADETN